MMRTLSFTLLCCLILPVAITAQEVPVAGRSPSPNSTLSLEGRTPTESGEVQVAQEEAQEMSVEEVVAQVQAFYDSIVCYHADFQQISTNIALDEAQVATGHVFFRKPGRMRWDYQAPEAKHIISNGETVWIWEPEFNQVAIISLADTDLPSALRFLMGEGVLMDDFNITLVDDDDPDSHRLHLVSRTGEGDYQYLEFRVDRQDFSVLETLVVDPIGNTNRFLFSNASTTDDLPAANFEFIPPPDARVVIEQ